MEEFLNIKKENFENIDYKSEEKEEIYAIQKLSLMKIIIPKYDPIEKYENYKKMIIDINYKIKELNYIKNSLVIFHKKAYNNEIINIIYVINNIETKPIREFFNEKIHKDIKKFMYLKPICGEINKVKDFLLFKKIYKSTRIKNENERFIDALKELNMIKCSFEKTNDIEKIFNSHEFGNIFENIKDELSKKDDSLSKKYISQMIDYFNIKHQNKKMDLKIMIKSKKIELVIKSIKFFIEDCLNKKLTLPKNIELSKMNLMDLRKALNNLKDNNIYDYESYYPFYKVFTSFYNKKEAIDFLLSKIKKTDFNDLKNKLSPSNRCLSIKDIDDAAISLNHFKKFINNNGREIIEYFKYLDEETINKIISYSKQYPLIIELDRENEKDIFEIIYIIIDNLRLTFKLDTENAIYTKDDIEKEIKIEELINLKNKINIQINNNNKKEEKDIYQIKCDKLIFFKKAMSNIEIIYDKIKTLRKKGYNVPILIDIEIKYQNIRYKFKKDKNEEEIDFNFIKKYLFTIVNSYEKEYETIYQNRKYLRFLYGKLFRKMKLHLETNYEINDIIRYILNKKEYDAYIIDGDLHKKELGFDHGNLYKEYTKQIFDNIDQYLNSLFFKNCLDFEKHYNNMLIKEDKKCKGIFISNCANISMEEYIVKLFQEKLGKLPIAQNILICSLETSIEEIQSFLYRAILCDYNTLFTIEILYSFSNFQYNKMYSYIDKLLSYKLEKYKRQNEENKNINKLNAGEYLDSCIYFIYKYLPKENSFLNELGKYKNKKLKKYIREEPSLSDDNEKKLKLDDLNLSNISDNSSNSINSIRGNPDLRNVKIFSSEVCGLGKSFKIRKIIKENNEMYYHFPLGGRLSKKIIYQKLLLLLKRIKKDADEKKKVELYFNNVAIHLDLSETYEKSLINEFLFSFFITKFYINNGDIIYIPNNIKIYAEIPNCSENYLSNFGILNLFQIDNITFGNLPKLKLYPDIEMSFQRILGIATNEEIEEFIKNNINLKEYSYYQIKSFINLFISQFKIFVVNKNFRF